MAENFYTILTKVGQAKIANATALGTKVNFTTLKVGDSNGTYYNPTEAQQNLVHTVWQGNINSINVDEENPNWIIIEIVIPSSEGGFVIREVGIFDDEGDLLAIGKYPETYKPQVADGSTKDITIRMILEVSNSATVTLKVDPTVTLATQEDIQVLRNQINTNTTSINNLAGSGRTTETVKGNSDAIVNLGGAGRTTETVKGNADAIAGLIEEVNDNKADLASQDVNKGASLIGIHDTNSQFTSTNVEGALNELAARPQKDVDNGRYQSNFGLEDAVLSGCNINSNVVSLGHSDTTTSQVNKNSAFTFDNSAYGVGQRISSAILQSVDEFYSVEVYVGSINSSGCDLKVSLYDKTAGVSLGQKILSAVSIKQGSNIFTFNAPIINPKGHDVEIRIDSNGTATSSNYCNVQYQNSNSSGDSTYISTLNSWSTVAENTSYDLYFVLKGGTYTTTGTTTKTYAPTDLKKWGNIKVTAANIGANNSATVTVTVKSSADVQLKVPVTLVNGDNYIDISDINSSTYPSLKLVFILNRNSVSDASPTISNVSVTWEGSIGIVNKGIIMQYTATDDLAKEVVFSGLNLKGYTKIELYIFARTTDANNDGGMSFKLNNGSAINLGLLPRGNQDNGWAVCSILDNIYNAMCMVNSSNQEIHGGMSNILLKDLISISVLNSSSTYFFKTGSKFILMGVS